jgi:hypothetical protein
MILTRLVPLALAAAVVIGCHDASDTHVTVQYVPSAGTGVQGFLASLEAGQTTKAFGVDADSLPAPVLELKTPASGFVVVTTLLVDSLGAIGGGATAIELRRDASFSVLVQIDSVNPSTGCNECLGAKGFVLPVSHQRVPADSIWIVWTATSGGTAITK